MQHFQKKEFVLTAPIPHIVDFNFQKLKNQNKQLFFTDNHYQ